MASLRDAVKVYQDELQAGIAWIAFWREGRSWSSDYIYLEMDDTLTPEDRSRLQEIQHTDPAAVVLNGYYCGYLGEDMNLVELTAGVRRHYANGYNNIAACRPRRAEYIMILLYSHSPSVESVAGNGYSSGRPSEG